MNSRAIVVETLPSELEQLSSQLSARYCVRCERRATVCVGLKGKTLLPLCTEHGRVREQELRRQADEFATVSAITPVL